MFFKEMPRTVGQSPTREGSTGELCELNLATASKRAEHLLFFARNLLETKCFLSAKRFVLKASRLDPRSQYALTEAISRTRTDVDRALAQRADVDCTHRKLWNILHACLQVDPGNRPRFDARDSANIDVDPMLHCCWSWDENGGEAHFQRRLLAESSPEEHSIPLPLWHTMFSAVMARSTDTGDGADAADASTKSAGVKLVDTSTLTVLSQAAARLSRSPAGENCRIIPCAYRFVFILLVGASKDRSASASLHGAGGHPAWRR